MNELMDIDFRITEDNFKKSIEKTIQYYDSYYSITPNYSIKTKVSKQSRANGNTLLEITVNIGGTYENEAIIYFEQDGQTKEIICKKKSFKNLNGKGYLHKVLGGGVTHDLDISENALLFLLTALKDMAIEEKGTIAYTELDQTQGIKGVCISDGNSISSKLCIVDANNKIYGAEDAELSSLSEGLNTKTSFNINIGDWNKQRKLYDTNFAQTLEDTTLTVLEKMDYIGKYVIELKNIGEIDYQEFKDIFHQAGLLSSGFTNPTLQTIYKLIV